MKTRSTKGALLMSALSLFLCFTMLMGTTFAWFTDSAASNGNIITAGTLDVEMYWADGTEAVPTADSGWTDASTGAIFSYTLWEPGYAEVRHIKIANEGNLALKYKVLIQANGQVTDLSDVIDVYYADPAVQVADASALTADNKLGTLTDVLANLGLTGNGTLEAGKSDIITLALKMQEGAGNEYMGKSIGTDFSIILIATQLAAEEDSFGPDYDADAIYPVVNTVVAGAGETVVTEGVSIKLPAAVGEKATLTMTVDNKSTTTDANGNTTVAMDIDLLVNGQKIVADGVTKYPVSVTIAKNLEVTSVTHKGEAVEFYTYDPTTGVLTFETDSFSPFTYTYKVADADSTYAPSTSAGAAELAKDNIVAVDENGNGYTTLKAAIDSGASTLYLKAGAELGEILQIPVDRSLTIFGNGAHVLGNETIAIEVAKNLTGNTNLTIYNLHGVAVWGNRKTEHTLNVNIYNSEDVRVFLMGTPGVTNIGLYNCTTTKANLTGDTGVYSNNNGTIIIDGHTFLGVECPLNINHKVAGLQTVTVKNSAFIDCATTGTAAYYAPIRLYNSVAGANETVTVSGNTFTYTDGKAPINGADVLLNKKHDGVDATGAIAATVQTSATVSSGANVTLTHAVYTAEDLFAVAYEVNKVEEFEKNSFDGKTILLMNDIDLGGVEWTPIGYFGNTSKQFTGVFDGQGHTISNFKITQKSPDRADKNRSSHGLFGNVNGTIKNLIVKDAFVQVTNDGRYVGGIVGRMNGGLVENCKLIDSHVEGSVWQIGGIVGQANAGTIENCAVENTTIVGKAGGVAAVAGFQVDAKELTIKNCAVKNCAIVQSAPYGGSYDDMFATILGCVNNSGATVILSGCTVENTTVKGVASTAAVGYVEVGATLTVDGEPVKVVAYDGVDLQATLNSLDAGDILYLPEGTIITTGTFLVPAGVTIIGDANGGTVIRQENAAQDDIFNCVGDVTIKNVTFESNRKGYAIAGNTKNHDTDGDIVVINCSFKGIAAEKNYGVYKNLNGNLTLKDCTFDNYNYAVCGVNNANGTTTTITGCTFTNINGEAIGYVASTVPADFEADAIANNVGLTAENVIGY